MIQRSATKWKKSLRQAYRISTVSCFSTSLILGGRRTPVETGLRDCGGSCQVKNGRRNVVTYFSHNSVKLSKFKLVKDRTPSDDCNAKC
jgi:hypothetical protein